MTRQALALYLVKLGCLVCLVWVITLIVLFVAVAIYEPATVGPVP